MIFYYWKENALELSIDGRESEIVFPEKSNAALTISEDRRYLAAVSTSHIYVFDMSDHTMISKADDSMKAGGGSLPSLCFDSHDRLYHSDRRSINRWDLSLGEDVCLASFPRTVHGPQGLKLNPSERYLSFYRYRSDADHTFLLRIDSGELSDLKITSPFCFWQDDRHLLWSGYTSIKMMDVETGEKRTVVGGYRSFIRRCNTEDVERLGDFASLVQPVFDVDLLGLQNGRLVFRLTLYQYDEGGIRFGGARTDLWSCDEDGSGIKYLYPLVEDNLRPYHELLEDGSYYGMYLDGHPVIMDGGSTRKLDRPWLPLICDGNRRY